MAKFPVSYHPAAKLEVFDAFDWYQSHSQRAAENFQREVERAQTAIQESPERWPAYLVGTKKYLLKRYPYLVVYHVAQSGIEIVAIAHASRKPGYWVDRLP
jgi:plasmid stabilization system protein ParE